MNKKQTVNKVHAIKLEENMTNVETVDEENL